MNRQRSPMSGQVVLGDSDKRAARVSCDPCRTKKIRCTGEHPVCSRCLSANRNCSYSMQLPMGRPKTRHTTCLRTRQASRRKLASSLACQHLRPVSHGGNDDAAAESNAPAEYGGVQQVQNSATATPYLLDFENYNRTHELQATYPSTVDSQAGANNCACLSVLYLILEQLRMKDQLIIPQDLAFLRDCVKSATQNATILGAFCVCMAECYARALEAIDIEERRASGANQRKQLSVTGSNDHALDNDAQCPTNPSTLFSLEITPSEWRNLMRSAVKAEIFSIEGSKEMCFMSLIEALEERQTRWHQIPPARNCLPTCRSLCNLTDGVPTCLRIVNEARKIINYLGL
ncbi:hypothetical protein V1509DRAFT_647726 [Lipomyces kononenkoae]